MKRSTSLSCLATFSIAFAGCAYSPITMNIEDTEDLLLGEAGGGLFKAVSLKNLSCEGTYSLLSQSHHLHVSFACSDGRTGNAQVLRTGHALRNGSGIGVLNDGKRVRILIGDMVHYRDAQGVWEKTSK